jgi:hypothetical protein
MVGKILRFQVLRALGRDDAPFVPPRYPARNLFEFVVAALNRTSISVEALARWRVALNGADPVAWLRGFDLSGLNLRELDLRGANLEESNLSGVNLRGMDMQHAMLDSTILRNAELSNANLSYAHLQHSDLRGAILVGVKLVGANIAAGNVMNANLRGADLQDAILFGANLAGVLWDEETNWPTKNSEAIIDVSEKVDIGVYRIRSNVDPNMPVHV